MKGLKESFRLIYSNTHLRTRETLPLSFLKVVTFSVFFCNSHTILFALLCLTILNLEK
jgi:hypothetical protein